MLTGVSLQAMSIRVAFFSLTLTFQPGVECCRKPRRQKAFLKEYSQVLLLEAGVELFQ